MLPAPSDLASIWAALSLISQARRLIRLSLSSPWKPSHYCWSRRSTSTLIHSKIKQIEHRQCNDGTGEPQNPEHSAHCVLSRPVWRGLPTLQSVVWRRNRIPDAPHEAPYLNFRSIRLIVPQHVVPQQAIRRAPQQARHPWSGPGSLKSCSALRARSSSLRSLPCRGRRRAASAARLKPDRTPERCS
jgi:hypothetical protein